MLLIVGIGVILAAIVSLLEGMFGDNRTTYTGPGRCVGQCAPDREGVLTDHGAAINTNSGRRGHVRHVEEQPEFVPFSQSVPKEWIAASQQGWREHQLAEKVDRIVAEKTEELKAEAKSSFWKLDR